MDSHSMVTKRTSSFKRRDQNSPSKHQRYVMCIHGIWTYSCRKRYKRWIAFRHRASKSMKVVVCKTETEGWCIKNLVFHKANIKWSSKHWEIERCVAYNSHPRKEQHWQGKQRLWNPSTFCCTSYRIWNWGKIERAQVQRKVRRSLSITFSVWPVYALPKYKDVACLSSLCYMWRLASLWWTLCNMAPLSTFSFECSETITGNNPWGTNKLCPSLRVYAPPRKLSKSLLPELSAVMKKTQPRNRLPNTACPPKPEVSRRTYPLRVSQTQKGSKAGKRCSPTWTSGRPRPWARTFWPSTSEARSCCPCCRPRARTTGMTRYCALLCVLFWSFCISFSEEKKSCRTLLRCIVSSCHTLQVLGRSCIRKANNKQQQAWRGAQTSTQTSVFWFKLR